MRDVLVLCYHAVSERWPADLSVRPGTLERQLAYLVERGYCGATFHQAVHSPPAPRTLAVTFDDGFRSVVELALPILERLGLPGTLFVPTDHVGTAGPMAWPGIDRWLGGPHEHELAGVSWEQLAGLAGTGWEIGSHTCSHPLLPRLDDEAIQRELAGSRDAVEARIGTPCRSLAYPYGAVDGRVVAAAGEAGYSAAAGLPARLHRPDPLSWPRVGIYHDHGDRRFRREVSRAARALRASPAGPPAEWAYRSLLRMRGRA